MPSQGIELTDPWLTALVVTNYMTALQKVKEQEYIFQTCPWYITRVKIILEKEVIVHTWLKIYNSTFRGLRWSNQITSKSVHLVCSSLWISSFKRYCYLFTSSYVNTRHNQMADSRTYMGKLSYIVFSDYTCIKWCVTFRSMTELHM